MPDTFTDSRFRQFRRVLPRDLFIESQLLKCLGKLVIHCDENAAAVAGMRYYSDDTTHLVGFDVRQDSTSGMLIAASLYFGVNGQRMYFGVVYGTKKSKWPLELMDDALGYVEAFDEDGNITPELTARLSYYAN